MTIGQFAEIALLSPKALRIYAERGLLEPVRIDPASGYRYYSRAQAPTGRLISLLRAAGVSLEETARVVRADDPAAALELLDELLRARRRESHAAESLLLRVRDHFLREASQPQGHAGLEDVSEAVVKDQFVLSHLSDVMVSDLDDHIRRTIERLDQKARTCRLETAGSAFGVFHGPVNGESAGPLEILLPVTDLCRSSEDIRSCRVHGGHLACVATNGPDTHYPAILTAYDQACSWIERQGFLRTGPPREIWEVLPWEGAARFTVGWPFARVANAPTASETP
jgi:DNA-binding transcriptional MerR regulator